jgi:predicted PurR-regulated permease PerM
MFSRLLLFSFITVIIFSFAHVISILDKLFEGFRSVTFRLRNDLRSLQPELKSWANEHLIKWDRNEMELLSLRQHRQIKKSFGHKIHRGVFQSIYHEPLIVYIQKIYRPEEAVLIARNSEHEFAYIITK